MSVKIPIADKLGVLFAPKRYKVIYGGRDGAKSWSVARALIAVARSSRKVILCTRETQKSISESVYRLISNQIESLGLSEEFELYETRIVHVRTKSTFLFAGIRQQNVDSLKSFEGVDICWVEEAQAVTKRSWQVLTPTIRKDGSEIWITFNPGLDTDETYQRFVVTPPSDAVVVRIGWQDNPWRSKALDSDREALKARDPDEYDHVYGGNPVTILPGAIYAKELRALEQNGRLGRVPHDPNLKVHVVADIGWNDATALIFAQKVSSEMRIIDYEEESQHDWPWWVQMVAKKNYRIEKWWLPHDAEHKTMRSGGKSDQMILEGLDVATAIVPNLEVETGIKQARTLFAVTYFNRETTERLVDCLKHYRRVINKTTNEPGSPLHDEYSHGSDAWRYLAIVADQLTNETVRVADPYKNLRRSA
jgi:phage terminase large subunit